MGDIDFVVAPRIRPNGACNAIPKGPATGCYHCVVTGNATRRKILTLDDLYHPDRKLNFDGKPAKEWVWQDEEHYLWRASDRTDSDRVWWTASVSRGTPRPLFDFKQLSEAVTGRAGAEPGNDPAPSVKAIDADNKAALVVLNEDLYLYRIESNSATRLASRIDTDAGAMFSPDCRWITWVQGNNIHIAASGESAGRGLTETGSPTLLCGRLDWVYQEEIYGRGEFRGYWWSPDSTRIAFLELDVSEVSERTLPNFKSRAGETVTYRYPRAGTPNPIARLGIVQVSKETAGTAPSAVSWVDLPETGDDRLLIVNVAWSPDGRVFSFQTQNREQTWLELFVVDPDSGKARSVLRESSKAWVRATGPPHWLDDGAFVWTSDRTGWSHLYLHAPGGQLVRPITSGEWDVREVHGIDNQTVYFSATERSAVSVHTYRVRLDGSGFERLTSTEGTHQSLFSPGHGHFIDTWSSVNSPAEVRLHTADGVEIRRLEASTAPDRDRYDLGRTEYLQVPARDGFLLEAMMIKPPNFDPNRKYPVLCHVYGGPMTPLVRNAWGGPTFMWHHMLAARGAIVWAIDNRTASGKGVESAYPAYRNFGSVELQDLEDGIQWLGNQRYIDPERIGIWGWSFGGYLTVYAMTHSRLFRIGIAGAPVTDWELYDTIYTERYMQTPEHNPEGYRGSSVLNAASDLHGKLLIVHGTADDNVHLDHSMQLIGALQRAHRDFEVMLYPGAKHGIDDPHQLYDLRRRMTDFILENL